MEICENRGGIGRILCATAAVTLIGSGCSDTEIIGPESMAPAFTAVPESRCATDADYVVRDRDGFLEALTTAPAGSTIAIDGMIEVDFDGHVLAPDLTFDCATPGSGLLAAAEPGYVWIFMVMAPGTTVQNLVLDASRSLGGAYLSDKNGVDAFAENVVLRGNTIRCASEECVLMQGWADPFASGATVSDNRIETTGGGQGIHVQGYSNVLVSGNVVHAASDAVRGILINQVSDLTVEGNVTTGAWARGMSFIDGVQDAVITNNAFRGTDIGVAMLQIERVAFVRNDVECGVRFCLLAGPGADLVVESSSFVSNGSLGGVNTFSGLERARIRYNRVAATAPSTDPALGGIRLRTGGSHDVSNNEITGPWANGVSVRDVRASRVHANRVTGQVAWGGLFLDMFESEVTSNLVSSTTGLGMSLDRSCRNAFTGNNVAAAAGAAVLRFESRTGANTYVGDPRALVDLGAFDCDGDGVEDPNGSMAGQVP